MPPLNHVISRYHPAGLIDPLRISAYGRGGRAAYRDLPRVAFPPIAHLSLPDQVDANVHPAKTEIRFRDPARPTSDSLPLP